MLTTASPHVGFEASSSEKSGHYTSTILTVVQYANDPNVDLLRVYTLGTSTCCSVYYYKEATSEYVATHALLKSTAPASAVHRPAVNQ